MKKTTKTHMRRFLKSNLGDKAGVFAEPRERTAASLFSDLVAVEGSDFNTTAGNFVPTARCIQDMNKRQLLARSGLHRLRSCV